MGVVGEQPMLKPGDTFEYSSGSSIPTAVGTMRGSYQLVAEDGTRFEARDPGVHAERAARPALSVQRSSCSLVRLGFFGSVHHTIATAIASASNDFQEYPAHVASPCATFACTPDYRRSRARAPACIAAARSRVARRRPRRSARAGAARLPAGGEARVPAHPRRSARAARAARRIPRPPAAGLVDRPSRLGQGERCAPSLEAFVRGCARAREAGCAGRACAPGRERSAPRRGERDIAAFFELNFDPVPGGERRRHDHRAWSPATTSRCCTAAARAPARYRYPIYARAAGPAHDRPVRRCIRISRTSACAAASRATASCPTSRAATSTATRAPLKGTRARLGRRRDRRCSSCTSRARGRCELENGERLRVGYADQNGHPFRSLGRAADPARRDSRRSAPRCRASRTGRGAIPRRCSSYMNANPSYVFFRELPQRPAGPDRRARRPAHARSARSPSIRASFRSACRSTSRRRGPTPPIR